MDKLRVLVKKLDDDVGKLPDDAVAALHGSAEL